MTRGGGCSHAAARSEIVSRKLTALVLAGVMVVDAAVATVARSL